MLKKLLILSFIIIGIFASVSVFAQTCDPDFPGCATCPLRIYEGINCGTGWYCNGCKTGSEGCFDCPRTGDPTGATILNYVSCTCQCPSGQIVCAGACTTAPTCATPTRHQDNSQCHGCGACKAGYSPDPANPNPPAPCLKTAYMDYANTGYFQTSGDLKSTAGDLYLANGKAIRVDGTGTTTFSIGNWGGGGTGADVSVWGNLNVGSGTFPRSLVVSSGVVVGNPTGGNMGVGSLNAEQLCIRGSCRTTWPEAVNAFVDEGNVGFGPLAVLGTNDNVPLAFEANNVERMRIDTAGNVGIGTTTPGTGLDVNGVINATTGYRVAGSATAGHYLRGNGTNFVSSAILAADLPGSFSGFANPTASVGLTAVNGSATTAMRSDAAPALSQAIIPTWTGTHTFSNATYSALFTGGNVGIGTINPMYKFDVAGQINVQTSSGGFAIFGHTQAAGGIGVYGWASDSSAANYGGFFTSNGSGGSGVYGFADGVGGSGVYGVSPNSSGYGIYGAATSVSGTNYGVYGRTNSPSGWGGYFIGGRGAYTEKLAVGSAVDPGVYRLYVAGNTNLTGNLTVGSGSGSDDDYIYFDDGTTNQYIQWYNIGGEFRFSHSVFSYSWLSGTQLTVRSGGYNQAVDLSNQKSIVMRHLGSYGLLETQSSVESVNAGNLILRSDTDYPANYVDIPDEVRISSTLTVVGNATVLGHNVCLQNGTNCPGGGTIGGSGTANYLAKFTGATTIGNSVIYDNGTNVGIGTIAPEALFDVQGAAQFGSGNVNLIDSTGKIPGISSTYFASVDGSALTGLNASNLASGTVPSVRLSGSYTGITGVGTLTAGVWNASTVGIAYGGTGLSTAPAAGQLLIGTGAAYNLTNLTGTANRVIVTNGAGSITLSTPQDIATTSSPTFATLTTTTRIIAPYGAINDAAYRFGTGAENTGFSSASSNQIDFITSGVHRGFFSNGGDFVVNQNIRAGAGTNIVYRCTTAGTLPVGALTTATGNCGASADTGLRVK